MLTKKEPMSRELTAEERLSGHWRRGEQMERGGKLILQQLCVREVKGCFKLCARDRTGGQGPSCLFMSCPDPTSYRTQTPGFFSQSRGKQLWGRGSVDGALWGFFSQFWADLLSTLFPKACQFWTFHLYVFTWGLVGIQLHGLLTT